jgi:hypothetical protein
MEKKNSFVWLHIYPVLLVCVQCTVQNKTLHRALYTHQSYSAPCTVHTPVLLCTVHCTHTSLTLRRTLYTHQS